MPPFAPPPGNDSGSDLDSDAPEAVPLGQTRKAVETEEKQRRVLQQEERKKAKERRRKADEQFKLQKSAKTDKKLEKARTSENDETTEADAVARMERAMRQAEEEGSSQSRQEEDASASEEEIVRDRSGIVENSGGYKIERLPDDIFSRVLAASTSKAAQKKINSPPPRSRKSKKVKVRSKDTIVGSRIIRPLERPAIAQLSSVAMTAPSRKVDKFLKRNLGLRKEASILSVKQGWQRRAANIGVMRSSGAPSHFARGQT